MTQLEMILEHLKAGNRIDKIKAINLFNCYVLFARMFNIHQMIDNGELKGYEYHSERDSSHHNSTVYWLSQIEKQGNLF